MRLPTTLFSALTIRHGRQHNPKRDNSDYDHGEIQLLIGCHDVISVVQGRDLMESVSQAMRMRIDPGQSGEIVACSDSPQLA